MVFWLPIGLVATILLLTEAGRWFGNRRQRKSPARSSDNSTIEAAVFGLMGLLVAFTFYGADTRFEARRGLIVEEANAINTAYLHLDLLDAGAQPELRENFRKYVRSRLAIYQKLPDWEAVDALRHELTQSEELQHEIWRQAVAASKQAGPADETLVLSSIDRMFDIATTQTVALQTHPPAAVWGMLALTLFASCVLAGYSMSLSGRRNWVHVVVFSILFSTVIYVNVDFEYPRMSGLIASTRWTGCWWKR